MLTESWKPIFNFSLIFDQRKWYSVGDYNKETPLTNAIINKSILKVLLCTWPCSIEIKLISLVYVLWITQFYRWGHG